MSAEQPLILSKKGSPFASEAAAKKHIKDEELDPKTNQVIPYNGRFAVLDVSSPKASEYLPPPEDEKDEDPTAPPARSSRPAKPEPVKPPRRAHPEDEHEFSWVTFMPSPNPNDSQGMTLGDNGVLLQFKRGVRVPIPRGHLENARNAIHHTWRQEPGRSRQVGSPITRAPYTYHGPATAENYWTEFRGGTKLRNEVLERQRMEEASQEAYAAT